MSSSQATPSGQPDVTLTIDGRTLHAPEGAYVLDVAKKAGIEIPTLCNHPDLEPVGACRVCMVEVTHPSWNGWSGLMTACLYPVKDGMQISTRSNRVRAARRGVLSLLVARCPNSETIRKLADQYEARADGLTTDPEADNCILCGLCTRVCESYATGSITTAGRGALKRIAAFADRPPSDCVACGACVSVCPTSEVGAERSATDYRIWDRSFPTAVCKVDDSRCVGCGSCEEACPFSVARVAFQAGGRRVAVIPAEFCRGCGACVGACPSGAIEQGGLESAKLCPESNLSRGTIHVFACGRSNLSRLEDERIRVTELPCAGRVTVPMLLNAVACGSHGALVLGRHQRTCRFEGAEDPVRDRVKVAQRVLDLVGLEPRRIQFDEPPPGPNGPRSAIHEFQASIASLPSHPMSIGDGLEREGFDQTLTLIERMATHVSSGSEGTAFLQRHGLPRPTEDGPSLLAGSTAALHVVGAAMFAPIRLTDVLHSALAVLKRLGVNAGVALSSKSLTGSYYSLSEGDRRAVFIDDFLRDRCRELPPAPRASKVATDGSDRQNRLVRALGYEPVDVGEDPLPQRFSFSPDERMAAERRLTAAERAGAAAFLVRSPVELARWATITRAGAWRGSRVLPILAVQLAHLAILEVVLTRRALSANAEPHAIGTEVAS